MGAAVRWLPLTSRRGGEPQKEADMDRITALRARRAGIIDQMEALVASVPEGEDMTADQVAQYDALKAEDDKVADQIKIAQDLQSRQAAAAKPLDPLPGAPAPVATVPAQPAEKGIRFARMVRAMAASGGIVRLAQEQAEAWGDSGLFANQNMTSGPAGGYLVPEDVSSEIIELLRPVSVIMRGGPRLIPLPNGNLTMNRTTAGATFGYVGEQQDILASGMSFGQVKLSAKKLTGLIPISNDLLRSASVAVDRLVRDDIVEGSAVAMDTAFLRSVGGDNAPLGLRHQLTGTPFAVTNILAVTAGNTLASITGDLGRMELALLNQNIPLAGAAWIGAPRTMMRLRNIRDGNGNFAFPEMQGGRLRNLPFFDTNTVPINLGGGAESELYLIAFPHVLVGEHSGMSIATSTEAAYRDASGTMQAAFSRDETVMRAIQHHDIGLRHLPAVAVLTGVNWVDA
jgi:HK97 family phage major capsid protein